MKIKTIDGKELEVKEDGMTLVYKGKEIKVDDVKLNYNNNYVLMAEKEMKSKLKTCINCKNFTFTPLSVNMGRCFKGLCKYRKKMKKKYIQYGDSIVSIFFYCDKFKLKK